MSIPDYYYNNDADSFAFQTCRERWPKIIQDAVNDIKFTVDKFQKDQGSAGEFSEQGIKIAQGLAGLINELADDKPLSKFTNDQVANIPGLKSYNDMLDEINNDPKNKNHITWLRAPWLFTECYLYRRIDTLVKQESKWLSYDIFENLKQKSFKGTHAAVIELAKRFKSLHENTLSASSNDELQLLFKEFIDVSLWGNKIDLSLLANKSQDDVHSGQSSKARQEAEKNILSNDTPAIWNYLSNRDKNGDKRIDFVLDNSGFETFTDLVFALFLLESSLAGQVVIHCKTRPWMVSDTMVKDVDILLQDLIDGSFFKEEDHELTFIHDQICKHISDGSIILKDSEFWTIGLDYWNLVQSNTKYYGSELYKDLIKSDLIFVKGDLNYRKLTGDRKWPKTEKFTTAIGPLSSNGLKIVALRTCKADVCVGLPEGINEKLVEKWHKETGELGELWSSSGNWAVISFSDGKAKK